MSGARIKTIKRAKPVKPISNAEVKAQLNKALDRMGLERGGHRAMHHKPKKS